jgi:hypothetical protein
LTDTSSEAWRAECEARYLLALADVDARRKYLKLVEAARGAAVRAQLEEDARRMFSAGQRGR